ncbi:Conserved_hypothetical protein [Hexamita inflata]|uniref:Transmembrane protein n=1 Tax=Hexamita inflata TaxID=28002 RepID=A0AA86UQN5_9EUKA|nr:Conserved hypothetical protein [Hexamita inflata]
MLFIQAVIMYTQSQILLNSFKNCYDASKISLDKNLRTFTIQLHPAKNQQCIEFPQDIGLNLTLYSPLFPDVLQIFVSDFSYLESDTFVFKIDGAIDLTLYKDESFASLTLFSYSQYTTINIQKFDELKSNLGSCFESITAEISNRQVTLQMCPLSSCIAQMVTQAQNSVSYIMDVQVSFNSQFFVVKKQDFLDAYQNQLCYEEVLGLNHSQYLQIIKSSFVYSYLQLNSQQGKTKVSLKYNVEVSSDLQQALFTKSEAFMYQNADSIGYKVIVDFEEAELAVLQNKLDSVQFNNVKYRLTGEISRVQTELVQRYSDFDMDRKIIDFSCSSGSKIDQEKCSNIFWFDFYAYYIIPTYNLDIIFLLNDEVVHQVQAPSLSPFYTCWRYGVVVVSKDKVEFQLERNHKCDGNEGDVDYSQSNVGFYIFDEQNSVVYEAFRTQAIEHAVDLNIFSFSCREVDCAQFAHNKKAIFVVEYYRVEIDKFVNSQDISAGYIIGGIVLIIISVVCLMKIIKTITKLKSVKRRK